MNRILKSIMFTICIILGISSYCYADDNTSYVTANVTSSYDLQMPSSIFLPYNAPNSIECCISFSNIFLEDGYALRVNISYDDFKHSENPLVRIPYTTDFSETIITKDNTNICFKINIDNLHLSTSPPGKYTSKIVVIIEYIKL